MRAVGIHLDEQSRTFGEADPERILVRAAEAELARAVKHPGARIGGGQPVCDLSCRIGRSVIDDQDVVAEAPHAGHDPLDVLALVVGGKHDQDLGGRRGAGGQAVLGAQPRSLTLTRCQNMSTELRIALTLVGAELRQTTGTSAIFTPRFLA